MDLRVPWISSNEQIFVSMIDNLESRELFLISIFESLEILKLDKFVHKQQLVLDFKSHDSSFRHF